MSQRSILLCILLSIVTCGLYEIYWIVKLNDELNASSGRLGTSGGVVILLSLVTCGLYHLYWAYQMGTAVEQIRARFHEPSSSAPVIYLLLSLFGLPIVAYALMQNELNQHGYSNETPV